MNKIKSSENIFPLPCWGKKKFAAGDKNESCAEYTPLVNYKTLLRSIKYINMRVSFYQKKKW